MKLIINIKSLTINSNKSDPRRFKLKIKDTSTANRASSRAQSSKIAGEILEKITEGMANTKIDLP